MSKIKKFFLLDDTGEDNKYSSWAYIGVQFLRFVYGLAIIIFVIALAIKLVNSVSVLMNNKVPDINEYAKSLVKIGDDNINDLFLEPIENIGELITIIGAKGVIIVYLVQLSLVLLYYIFTYFIFSNLCKFLKKLYQDPFNEKNDEGFSVFYKLWNASVVVWIISLIVSIFWKISVTIEPSLILLVIVGAYYEIIKRARKEFKKQK